MHRFFICDATTYDNVRNTLDSAWGHPKTVGGVFTSTCTPVRALMPKDLFGRVYIAMAEECAAWPEVSALLIPNMANGKVQEILEFTWRSLLPLPRLLCRLCLSVQLLLSMSQLCR